MDIIISEMDSDRGGSKTTGVSYFFFFFWPIGLRLQTILNLWYVYHSMLELRAFLLQKGISCYSDVKVGNVHLSDNFQFAADKDLSFSIL